MALKLDACIAQHLGDRQEQQDRIALIAHRQIAGACLAVVADGMGGHTGGAMAAEQVIISSSSAFQSWGIDNDPREILRGALLEAHDMIRASRYLNEKDPHSTSVFFMLLPGRRCFWSHCGDSRLYAFRGRRMLFRTRDHSYVEHLIQKGRITRREAETHPNRNILLTSLGGKETPRIEFGDLEALNTSIQDRDSFLLCSDGLWGYLQEQEMAEIISDHPAKVAAARLIEIARERANGDGDNLSLALLKFQEEKPTWDYQKIQQNAQAARERMSETQPAAAMPQDEKTPQAISSFASFLKKWGKKG
jgi:serine/threonine protein phosphatase PrpC